jgi:nucleoside-diphosphate-sugar epimerase
MVYGPVINAQTIATLNTSSERLWKFLSGNVKTIEPTGAPLWVDVRDLAQAHLAAYEKKEAGGNRFFIVADELYSNQDVADIYRKVSSLQVVRTKLHMYTALPGPQRQDSGGKSW